MTTRAEDPQLTNKPEDPKQPASACCPGCACTTTAPSSGVRWIVGAIILVAAGVLVARGMVKDKGGAPATPAATFATASIAEQTLAPATNEVSAAPDTVIGNEIGALTELNAVAADTVGVFVFLPGKTETTATAPMAQILAAAKTIEAQGGKVGYFTLKTDSRDYQLVSARVAVPGVLAMVKGAGTTVVSGDITETTLVQAYVAASSAGGCGPASGGCGPVGCK